MWLVPLLTLGLVSVLAFVQGALLGMVQFADGTTAGAMALPGFFVLLGVVGIWGAVRLTPER